MASVNLWAWDDDNKKWVKIAVDADGKLQVEVTPMNLDDLTDVYVPAPTDGYILYWDEAATRWKAKAIPAAAWAAAIVFIIDGGGAEITLGEKGHLEIPFACTINRVTLLADQSGDIEIDIWKDTYANFPPTVADSITAAAKPTITAAQKAQDTTLVDWTTAIAAGDILAFKVDSVTDIERVTLVLKVTKT